MNHSIDHYADLLAASHQHLRSHNCGAYPFGDGVALTLLASAVGAKRIIELGTALGYTACCFARGSTKALIDTIEMDAEHVTIARANIAAQGFSSRITIHQGIFDAVLPNLESDVYDIAFFDGFEPHMAYFNHLTRILKKGGMLITANLGLGGDTTKCRDILMGSDAWISHLLIEDGKTAVSIKL